MKNFGGNVERNLSIGNCSNSEKDLVVEELSKVLIFNPQYMPGKLQEFMQQESFSKWQKIKETLQLELMTCSDSSKRFILKQKLDRINNLLLKYWDLEYNDDILKDGFFSCVDLTNNEIIAQYPIYDKMSQLDNALNGLSSDYNRDVFYILVSLLDYRKMGSKLYDFIINSDLETILDSLKVSNYKEFLEKNNF